MTALEHATGVQAIVVGKPTKTFFETVINDFSKTEILPDIRTGRIAVIGDDIEADLGEGAVELNLWRILGKRNHIIFYYILYLISFCLPPPPLLPLSSENWEISRRR